jgi:tetratricopeptide (TPR) repeat protein
VLAIREPLISRAPSEQLRIVAESPSDVIFVEAEDHFLKEVAWDTGEIPPPEMSRTVIKWKEVGDICFNAKEFLGAVAAYSHALKRKPLDTTIRLNRCLAYIRLKAFKHALQDAETVIQSDHDSQAIQMKANYRAAQASYAASRWSEAKAWYQKCLKLNPGLEEAKDGYRRCEARLRENERGEYDWTDLYGHILTPNYKPDIANYEGPFTITSIPNKGRGIVANRDINTRELSVSTQLARLLEWNLTS